jgi:hypothetical protein
MTPDNLAGIAGSAMFLALCLGAICWAQRREIERLRVRGNEAWRQRCEYKAWCEEREGHTEAMLLIAAMETPRANATVKRMAKTARAALEGLNNAQA